MRVLEDIISRSIPACVRHLGNDISPADGYGVEFIFPDVAIEQLLLPGGSVENPPSFGFHERDGKRPVLETDVQNRLCGGFVIDVRIFGQMARKLLQAVFLGDGSPE